MNDGKEIEARGTREENDVDNDEDEARIHEFGVTIVLKAALCPRERRNGMRTIER